MAEQLALIPHQVERGDIIHQRAVDGYVNATAMCKAAGKLFADFVRLRTTQPFLAELSSVMGIPITELIQSVRGGNPHLQGTWVHPHVAISLAQWLSPTFAVKVSQWVWEWAQGDVPGPRRLPDHVRRYMVNRHKIPATHFSMLDQMTLRLLAPLEAHGYTLSAKMMPDIALGRMFSAWCRSRGHKPDLFPTYSHEFIDHRPTVSARLYPNKLITDFNVELESWLRDGRALKYFRERDQNAVYALEMTINALPAPETEEDST